MVISPPPPASVSINPASTATKNSPASSQGETTTQSILNSLMTLARGHHWHRRRWRGGLLFRAAPDAGRVAPDRRQGAAAAFFSPVRRCRVWPAGTSSPVRHRNRRPAAVPADRHNRGCPADSAAVRAYVPGARTRAGPCAASHDRYPHPGTAVFLMAGLTKIRVTWLSSAASLINAAVCGRHRRGTTPRPLADTRSSGWVFSSWEAVQR